MNQKEKTILYIDDDSDDRQLLWETMQKIAPELNVKFAENGLHALEILDETNVLIPLPCLIVLDLNMPFLDGRETYLRIKGNSLLNNIPIIVFSSGANPTEKSFFNKEGITYFTKPMELAELESIATHMVQFCL